MLFRSELDGRKFDVIIVSIAPSERGTQPNFIPVANSVIWHIIISRTSGG